MQWDSIQSAAKTNGRLVFAMDQGSMPPATQPGPWGGDTAGGWCKGLSTRWIALGYAGRNFLFDPRTLIYDSVDPKSLEIYQRYLQAPRPIGQEDDETFLWKTTLAACQMLPSQGLRAINVAAPMSAAFFTAVLRQAYGCYAVSLLGEEGSHAIALRHTRDNRFHLFDPNYGHFAVRDLSAFEAFLKGFLKDTGYAARYALLQFICGVKPPINHGEAGGV